MSADLIERIADGRTDLVFDFLAAGGAATSPGPGNVRLIRWCARYGDVSAVRILLAHGETLASLGENFDLAGAAFHGHWRLCEFLLEQGADVNHTALDTGETALHGALCKPNRPAYDRVVAVLLEAGADPNLRTKLGAQTDCFMRDARTLGETPLHRAAAFGSAETIQRLLDCGATIDAKDMNGDTPLAWASWHTRPDAVLRLLCYGDHRIRPDRASTFDHGRGWGHLELDLLGKPRSD